MTVMLLILLAGLSFFLQLQTAARLRKAESAIAGLRQELAASRGSARQTEPGEVPGETGPEAAVPAGETIGGLFERLVGGRLLIWIGGIALAAAGIFLIRHSIGLLTPEVRMIAAALLGLLLIVAGEYARGGRLLADDPRIGQSLVGAGIAILYATVYGSYLLFALIGSGAASTLMLLITAAALALSLRHGAPTAFIGIVGGFLTPLLVGDPDAGALPVLFYLALLDVAVFAIAWRRGWPWLAAAAVAASFAWTGYFVVQPPKGDALQAGLFAAVLAIAASLPRARQGRQLILLQPPVIGLVELTMLTARWDVERPAWLLFGGLAAATLPLSVVRPDHRFAPPAALVLALLLIAFKSTIGSDPLTPWAAAVATLLFAGGSAVLARRAEPERAFTAALALAAPLLILRTLRPELLAQVSWGGLALALAVAALGLLWLLRTGSRGKDPATLGAFGAGATATLLLAMAGYDLAPRDFISGAWLVTSVALLIAGVRIPDKALRLTGLLLLTATIARVFLIDAADLEGVLRILSFLALGAALIWIGRFYPRVLNAERKAGG